MDANRVRITKSNRVHLTLDVNRVDLEINFLFKNLKDKHIIILNSI